MLSFDRHLSPFHTIVPVFFSRFTVNCNRWTIDLLYVHSLLSSFGEAKSPFVQQKIHRKTTLVHGGERESLPFRTVLYDTLWLILNARLSPRFSLSVPLADVFLLFDQDFEAGAAASSAPFSFSRPSSRIHSWDPSSKLKKYSGFSYDRSIIQWSNNSVREWTDMSVSFTYLPCAQIKFETFEIRTQQKMPKEIYSWQS